MARARESLIDLNATPYYHCINRCIRRSYLCGDDKFSGNNFDHRRTWLVDRIKLLASIFSIDIAAYAIMSNHYHLVLKVSRDDALNWSDEEVISRWYKLYNGCVLIDRYLAGEKLSKAYLLKVTDIVNEWRYRLFDISWFMRNLNEFIARKANAEDKCTGRFWEGRFKSQALLDETALLSCMMYVDLNPIRSGITDSLNCSDFTSIKERINQYLSFKKQQNKIKILTDIHVLQQPNLLLPFGNSQDKNIIPFTLIDYLELAEFSRNLILPNKRRILTSAPNVLKILNIETNTWINSVKNFRRQYANFAGTKPSLMKCAHDHHHSWYKGCG